MNTRKPQTDLFGHGTCQLRSRVWIEGPDGTFPGYSRVVLLERIRDYGSISAAARSGSDSQSVNRAELDGDQFFESSHIRLPPGRVRMARMTEAFGPHGEGDRMPDVFATTRGEARRMTVQ